MPDQDLNLPKIPVTPIGYGDAIKYLEKIGGDIVNKTWKGGLNITYRYGPSLNSEYNSRSV